MIVESVEDIIKVSGNLTSNQWEAIRTAADLLLKKHPEGVVVDCSGLELLSPAGAQTFYDMLLHIESQSARIIVANVPEHIEEELKHVPEVRSRLAMASSVEDARSSLELLDSLTPTKGRRIHSTGKLILALSGGASDPYATALAAAIAQLRQLTVVALYPIIVHRALPATTPMPEIEKMAGEALVRAEDALKARGIPVELTVKRGRELCTTIEELAQEMDELSVVAALPDADPRKNEPDRTAKDLLEKVSSEVVLVREPLMKPGEGERGE